MSVFDRLAARATSTVPTLATRRAGRFEPGPGQEPPPVEPTGSPHATARMPDDGADASAVPPASGDPGAGVAGTAHGRARNGSGTASPAGTRRSSSGASYDTSSSDGPTAAAGAGHEARRGDAARGEPSGGSVPGGRIRAGRPEPATPDPSGAHTTRRAGRGTGPGARTNPRADAASPRSGRGDRVPGNRPSSDLPGDRRPDGRFRAGPLRNGSPTATARQVAAAEDSRSAATPRTRPGAPPSDRTDGTPAGRAGPAARRADGRATDAPGTRSTATDAPASDGGRTGPRRPPSGSGAPGPAEPATRTLTRDELLARLTPALVADGTLSRSDAERLVAVPARVTDRRRASGGTGEPGDTGLPADRPAVGLDPLDVPAGDVHVHIGRVDVHHPDPQPAPQRPERQQPPRVDHSAYLARQEGRWRR
ncbi:hypothetical protein GCM10027059_36530 [Myceligenerans halotolerans]